MQTNHVANAFALPYLRSLPDASVQMCVTSPPYWGKRQYGTMHQVWGGVDGCKHKWNETVKVDKRGNQGKTPEGRDHDQSYRRVNTQHGTCAKCGAWKGELGQEPSPELFIEHLVQIFAEVRRVLKPDGVCFVNLGDTYFGGKGVGGSDGVRTLRQRVEEGGTKAMPNHEILGGKGKMRPQDGKHDYLKQKDLCLVPHLFAVAMQRDGWYLRNEVIWYKSNGMPESVTDRFVTNHETIFLFTKSKQYYFDWKAVSQPIRDASVLRHLAKNPPKFGGEKMGEDDDQFRTYSGKDWKPKTFTGYKPGDAYAGNQNWNMRKAQPDGDTDMAINGGTFKEGHSGYFTPDGELIGDGNARCRDVWDIPGQPELLAWMCANGFVTDETLEAAMKQYAQQAALPGDVWQFSTAQYKDAHFAVFPEELPKRCILAGSRFGDVVLDPFMGSQTTAIVAHKTGRQFVGCEPNADYWQIGNSRYQREALGLGPKEKAPKLTEKQKEYAEKRPQLQIEF